MRWAAAHLTLPRAPLLLWRCLCLGSGPLQRGVFSSAGVGRSCADVETILGWAVAHAVLQEPECAPGVPSDADTTATTNSTNPNAGASATTSSSAVAEAQPGPLPAPAPGPAAAESSTVLVQCPGTPHDPAARLREAGRDGGVALGPGGLASSLEPQLAHRESGGAGLPGPVVGDGGAPAVHQERVPASSQSTLPSSNSSSVTASASASASGTADVARGANGSVEAHALNGGEGPKGARKVDDLVGEEAEDDGDDEDDEEDEEEEILVVPAARSEAAEHLMPQP